MENNKNLLEEFTKEILDTAEKYFELKGDGALRILFKVCFPFF